MPKAIIRFYESDCFFDTLIQFRLESNWVHATIEVGGLVYSATSPRVIAVPSTDPEVSIPDRIGAVVSIDITEEQETAILEFLKPKVAKSYDDLSVLGWILRCRFLQIKHLYYCFELVYSALSYADILEGIGKDFISGDQLLASIEPLDGYKVEYSNIAGPVMSKPASF